MRRIVFNTLFIVCWLPITATGQTNANEISVMEKNLNTILSKQAEIDKKLLQLSEASDENKSNIQTLEQRNEVLCKSIDSLKTICESLNKAQAADRAMINGKIQDTNNVVASNQSIVENRTLWGVIIICTVLIVSLSVFYYLTKRIKKGSSSIYEIRKAQDALQTAQIKMQEESVTLDNKMIELCAQQIKAAPTDTGNTQTDHSLALKVADEIVRIEMNLSRMDSSIKGYKQLAKAVQRIKDNFNANGYEIVDMLGKSYNAGMKAAVTFVTDESLEQGQQIITKIIKPQINYQQQMIQPAQIEVSQAE